MNRISLPLILPLLNTVKLDWTGLDSNGKCLEENVHFKLKVCCCSMFIVNATLSILCKYMNQIGQVVFLEVDDNSTSNNHNHNNDITTTCSFTITIVLTLLFIFYASNNLE